jgi:hypothetical protein
MCDLIRITVTLIHPANEAEQQAAVEQGVAGVLSIQSGTSDIPKEGDIDVADIIGAIASALPVIAESMEREYEQTWAHRREEAARQN